MHIERRLIEKTARIGIIGLGYVGLPLAITAIRTGYPVTGFDIDSDKIAKLKAGKSYVEAVTDQDLGCFTDSAKVLWTDDDTDIGACDVVILCVPTPLTPDKTPDLRFLERATRMVARQVINTTLVIVESTTFPGTTEGLVQDVFREAGLVVGRDIFIGYSPEREDPGNTHYKTNTIPKVVSGLDAEATKLAITLYSNIVDVVVPVSSTRVAEAVKITENAFRAVNVGLVNELKIIFDLLDIDIWEVVDAAATKPFGYMPFYPGPGIGGHCIPIDPLYLSWKARQIGLETKFIDVACEINGAMPGHVVRRVQNEIGHGAEGRLEGKCVLVVGLSYKRNVSDTRESPSLTIIAELCSAGALVHYHDPLATSDFDHGSNSGALRVEHWDDGFASGQHYDAVVIATDHDDIDFEKISRFECPIFDTRNAIRKRNLSPGKLHLV